MFSPNVTVTNNNNSGNNGSSGSGNRSYYYDEYYSRPRISVYDDAWYGLRYPPYLSYPPSYPPSAYCDDGRSPWLTQRVLPPCALEKETIVIQQPQQPQQQEQLPQRREQPPMMPQMQQPAVAGAVAAVAVMAVAALAVLAARGLKRTGP